MSKFLKYMVEEKSSIEDKILDFLSKNPSPKDDAVHKLSDELGIETDEFESMIYGLLGSIVGHGKAKEKNFTEKDADKEQVKMGIKVEMEHTNNKTLAKRITLDHLAEIPDYYTRLKKMESEAGVED